MDTWVFELNWLFAAISIASTALAIKLMFDISHRDYVLKSMAYDNHILRTGLIRQSDKFKLLADECQRLTHEFSVIQSKLKN